MTSTEFDPKVMGGSIKRKIVNPDLLDERALCTFDKDEAYNVIFPEAQRREFALVKAMIKKHPQIASSYDYYEKSRLEKFKEWWERFRVIMSDPEYSHLMTNNTNKDSEYFNWHFLFAGTNPMTYHQVMFSKGVLKLGNEEQVRTLIPQSNHWQMIGCYAQTELGHGSNVAGLETTATFDVETDEFVIHTPTFKAAKFWPGNLAWQANHALLYARCISNGKDYGVQSFVVPIRDMENHTTLPGCTIGDIGTKLGYNSIDNGYLLFDQYRVPRSAMLARFAAIDRQGKIKMVGNPRMIYQIMVQTRIAVAYSSINVLQRSAQCAIRYAACRRQFSNQEGTTKERKLLDYQLHMDVLASNLSKALILQTFVTDIVDMESASTAEIEAGKYESLDLLHHVTSGMKALVTDMVYIGTDELRQACGGAGFILTSGIADWWAEGAAFPTFEGVNTVMYQQSSRLLLKQAAMIAKGKTPNSFFAYLQDMPTLLSSKSGANTVEEFLSHDHIQRALATRAAYMVKKVLTAMTKSKDSASVKQNDKLAIEINRMVKVHIIYKVYSRACEKLRSHQIRDANLTNTLMTVFANFALKDIIADTIPLYDSGFFTAGQSSELLEGAYEKTLVDLRPQMVGLAEINPDMNFPTTIGNEYGDIYESQFDTAVNSRLNSPNPLPELFRSHLKPVMTMIPAPKL